MSMNVGDKKGSAIADINVTPMADIMIVLLIIFMVITPMLAKGVDVTLPKAENSKEKAESQKNITVAVTAKGRTYMNGVEVENSAAGLLPKLREKVDELPDTNKVVYLKADITLPYKDVMTVMDFCREAGAEQVALIAEKKVQG